MAERSFFILPADPLYLPNETQRAAAVRFFQEVSPLPNANGDYRVYVSDAPELLDAGEALEAVICPECEARIDLMHDEGDEWWSAVRSGGMGKDARTTMPCCGAEVAVLDLTFDEPSYFQRFAVGALEPSFSDPHWERSKHGFETGLTREAMDHFEKLIGCKIHQMWRIGY